MQKCPVFATCTLQRSQKLTESNRNRPLRRRTFMFYCIWDFFVFFVLSCVLVLSCTFMFSAGDFYVRGNGYGRFKVRAGPSTNAGALSISVSCPVDDVCHVQRRVLATFGASATFPTQRLLWRLFYRAGHFCIPESLRSIRFC